MAPLTNRARSAVVAGAFIVSGLTSYITLAASKRTLSPSDFGQFAVFWSVAFFVAVIAASPNEQELSRSLAVRFARGVPGYPELVAAFRSTSIATALALAVCVAASLSGFFGNTMEGGIFAALLLLVVGESLAALVRGEMAARRDTSGLVSIVAGQGIVRVVATLIAGIATGSLVLVCFGVALSIIVPAAFVPTMYRRRFACPDVPSSAYGVGVSATSGGFSGAGVRRLALAMPPRALFAIGTPILAGLIAGDDQTALVGDVLVALSLTSAPVLVAGALQVVLLPEFSTLVERGHLVEIRRQLWIVITSVLTGTVLVVGLTLAFGVRSLELLFGPSPGIDATSLSLMALGAGLLFLANLLSPVGVAIRHYSTVTFAWTSGALVLIVVGFAPGDVAFVIGRAVFVGALVVDVLLLWGVRQLLFAQWTDRDPGQSEQVGVEA